MVFALSGLHRQYMKEYFGKGRPDILKRISDQFEIALAKSS